MAKRLIDMRDVDAVARAVLRFPPRRECFRFRMFRYRLGNPFDAALAYLSRDPIFFYDGYLKDRRGVTLLRPWEFSQIYQPLADFGAPSAPIPVPRTFDDHWEFFLLVAWRYIELREEIPKEVLE